MQLRPYLVLRTLAGSLVTVLLVVAPRWFARNPVLEDRDVPNITVYANLAGCWMGFLSCKAIDKLNSAITTLFGLLMGEWCH